MTKSPELHDPSSATDSTGVASAPVRLADVVAALTALLGSAPGNSVAQEGLARIADCLGAHVGAILQDSDVVACVGLAPDDVPSTWWQLETLDPERADSSAPATHSRAAGSRLVAVAVPSDPRRRLVLERRGDADANSGFDAAELGL